MFRATVYHSKNHNPFEDFQGASINLNDYERVGEVQVYRPTEKEALEEIFFLTNHLDGNWTMNPEVKAVRDSVRSTQVGDVIHLANIGLFGVKDKGFVKLNPACGN